MLKFNIDVFRKRVLLDRNDKLNKQHALSLRKMFNILGGFLILSLFHFQKWHSKDTIVSVAVSMNARLFS